MFYKLAKRLSFDDFDEAMAAVREVGPGGHYLGTVHTQEHFQTAFFMPDLLDNNNYEQWLANGASDSNARGLSAAKAMLDRYEEPALDPSVDEALREFMTKRERELPNEVI